MSASADRWSARRKRPAMDDGIHPNADAQPQVLDNAWPTLRPLLLGNA